MAVDPTASCADCLAIYSGTARRPIFDRNAVGELSRSLRICRSEASNEIRVIPALHRTTEAARQDLRFSYTFSGGIVTELSVKRKRLGNCRHLSCYPRPLDLSV